MADPIEFTDSTPRFSLPFLFSGQSQKEFFVNEAHALADMLLHTSVKGELAAAPLDAVDGDIWVVAAGATGDWAGQDGKLTGMQGGVWKFVAPIEGMRIFDQNAGQMAIYLGAWQRPTPPDSPDSGQTVDAELRLAFGQLTDALKNAGVFPIST